MEMRVCSDSSATVRWISCNIFDIIPSIGLTCSLSWVGRWGWVGAAVLSCTEAVISGYWFNKKEFAPRIKGWYSQAGSRKKSWARCFCVTTPEHCSSEDGAAFFCQNGRWCSVCNISLKPVLWCVDDGWKVASTQSCEQCCQQLTPVYKQQTLASLRWVLIFLNTFLITVAMTSQPTNESELQLYRVLQRSNLLSYYDTFICQGKPSIFFNISCQHSLVTLTFDQNY